MAQIESRIVAPSKDVAMKDAGEDGESEADEEEADETSPLDRAARELLDPAMDDVTKSARTIVGVLQIGRASCRERVS